MASLIIVFERKQQPTYLILRYGGDDDGLYNCASFLQI